MDKPPITNAAKLPWPQDRAGMTSQLKREGCRAIGRMGGNPERFDVVLQVLRVLAHHAEAKLTEQSHSKEEAVLKLAQVRVLHEEMNDQQAMAMENSLHRQKDALDLRLVAIRSRKADAKRQWEEVLRRRAAGEDDNELEDARAQQGIGSAIR